MSEAVTAIQWKSVGYLGPMGVASMAPAIVLFTTCSFSRSHVLRYPLPTAVSSLQDSRAHSVGLKGTGCTAGVNPLSMEEIIRLTAMLNSCAVTESPKPASSKMIGSLGLYLNEALASLTATPRLRLLSSLVDWGTSTLKGFSGAQLEFLVVSSRFPVRMSGGVFGVRVSGGGCWSTICRDTSGYMREMSLSFFVRVGFSFNF